MEILIATNNPHKVIELGRIFTGYHLLKPDDIGVNFEFEETGGSFLENAYGKAAALFKQTGKPVIADDSGLCVTSLNNEPGIYSARYGMNQEREQLSASEKNNYLLAKMRGISDRSAFFVCCMVLVIAEHRFIIAQETVAGEIAYKSSGVHGFGYDPLFFIPGDNKTMAELDDDVKDQISHRGKASRILLENIRNFKENHP